MYSMTRRDIAGLTPAERIQGHVERFIGESSRMIERMAARNRRRAVRAAIDHDENNGEQQIPPDAE